jgi:hypothetical protein
MLCGIQAFYWQGPYGSRPCVSIQIIRPSLAQDGSHSEWSSRTPALSFGAVQDKVIVEVAVEPALTLTSEGGAKLPWRLLLL